MDTAYLVSAGDYDDYRVLAVFTDEDARDVYLRRLRDIGDKDVFLAPNCPIEVCTVQGDVISVELPNTVELTVEDTPPQVKGATVTNQQKEAVCEGGARVRVPPFIENGEVIRVDTRTGEYLGRA